MTAVLRISAADNVAVTLEAVEPGAEVNVAGGRITVRDSIPAGHKIAIAPIAAGEPVLKYGCPIGRAICGIETGQHVHTHNVESTRGRGDRNHA